MSFLRSVNYEVNVKYVEGEPEGTASPLSVPLPANISKAVLNIHPLDENNDLVEESTGTVSFEYRTWGGRYTNEYKVLDVETETMVQLTHDLSDTEPTVIQDTIASQLILSFSNLTGVNKIEIVVDYHL